MVSRSYALIMELPIGTCSYVALEGLPSSGMVSSAVCWPSEVVFSRLFGMGLDRCSGRTDGYLDVLQ